MVILDLRLLRFCQRPRRAPILSSAAPLWRASTAASTFCSFATPVLGGQASIGIGALIGPNTTSAFGTVTGPGGLSLSGNRTDSVFGIGDLYPTGSLRWNQGVNNVMTYLTGDIPVGLYNAQNLANLGIGHGVVDAGGGYTYFDPQTGDEFSAVIGATYNLINPSTQYQNGIDESRLGSVAIPVGEPSSRRGRLRLRSADRG
jgi:hypothetical protein